MAKAALLTESLAKELKAIAEFMRRNPKFLDTQRTIHRPTPQEGTLFYNDSGEDIPPFAAMEVTDHEVNDRYDAVKVDKIGTTWPEDLMFNGSLAVPADKFGYSQRELRHVLYSTGTPVRKEVYGIKPNEWALFKGYPAVLRVRGIHDTTNKIIYGKGLLPITHFLGKTEVSVSAGASLSGAVAGAYKIYGGTKGSEVDGGWTTVPAVWFRVSLDAGVWFRASWLNNGWEGEPLSCE